MIDLPEVTGRRREQTWHETGSLSRGVAESAHLGEVGIPSSGSDCPRHSTVVRLTHWITALSFAGLLFSGFAILLVHPRLYWGETGAIGAPSLIDLPIPLIRVGQTGWGRHLHFLSAWLCVLAGLVYTLSGLITHHFRKDLVPARADLAWKPILHIIQRSWQLKRPLEEESLTYNVLQRLIYLVVLLILFPTMVWTGLAMSPALTSVFPALVVALGGQQSARTLHFFVTAALCVFVVIHVAMVCRAGFTNRVWAMITGRSAAGEEHS